MLCLSRKEGQKIYVGDAIVITIIEIDRGRVRIGIEAPAHIEIFREEILPPDMRPQPATENQPNPNPTGLTT